MRVRFCSAAIWGLSLSLCGAAWAKDPFAVILVDKKTNRIHLGQYNGGKIDVLKTYHATLGKIQGDKVQTDDKKTPEGVYFVTAKRTPPQLQKKFGAMAFPVDYPNVMDRQEKKTGFGIMLHSTDDPARLTRDYDSDGCVVVDNHEIEEISHDIRLGLTPVVIYPELKNEYLTETHEPGLKEFFSKWVAAWQGKDIDNYIAAYDSTFQSKGMGVRAYKDYKRSLNQKYDRIVVKIENPRFFYHPKYDVVYFTQKYESFSKSGAKAFVSNGTKVLYIRHNPSQPSGYSIMAEDFNHVMEDDYARTASAK